MIRIFMTGDNHIGRRYANHEKSWILSEKRRVAFERMVQTANAENCSIFVITGDLFDRIDGISEQEIADVLDRLSEFRGNVVILPGNHDYYDKESNFWQYFNKVIHDKDNILLLTEYQPYSLRIGNEEVVLYPAHCTSKHSIPGENNLGWIKSTRIDKDNAYHIGVAHGAVEGETIDKEGQYFLMSRAELEDIAMDVWLIGHTHVPFPSNLSVEYTNAGRIYNAGTHVQLDVNCNTEGQCFIIELENNKPVRAKKVITGNLRFYRENIELRAGDMENILEERLRGIGDDSVVDLIFSGAVSTEEYNKRHLVFKEVMSRFIEGTYHDMELSELISKEKVEAEFAETSFSAKLLTSLLDNPKEAQLTYELLNALGGKS